MDAILVIGVTLLVFFATLVFLNRLQARREAAGGRNRGGPTVAPASPRTLAAARSRLRGCVASAYTYDPDGKDATAGTGSDTSIRFAGGHRLWFGSHRLNGVYHFGARHYDTSTARWTQLDPLNQVADLRQANRYTYAGGNPMNLIDPSGQRGCVSTPFLGEMKCGPEYPSKEVAWQRTCFVVGSFAYGPLARGVTYIGGTTVVRRAGLGCLGYGGITAFGSNE